ncbi:MAG: hypothetical protein H8E37_11980, partial [Planctomycetes bacterium]|nr:hypothetical protein [Planctomycetota bacterium]
MIVHREHWRDSENNIRQGFRCVRIAGFILPLALLIFWHFGAGLFGSPFGDSGPVARHLLKQALAAVFVLWPAAWLEDVRTGLGTLLMASVTVISLNATVLLGTGTAGCDIPLPLMALSPLTGLGLTGLFVFLRPPGTQRPTRGFWHFSIVVLLAATAFAASESVRVWRQVIAARTLAEHGWMMKLDRGVDVPTEVWSGT